MEEKLKRVTLWLTKVFGSEPIPEYEVNQQTVDFLYDLAECNEARERDTLLLIEDMKQRAAEYEAQTKYLESLLGESLALSPQSLSSKGTSDLNVLVSCAMTLETKDTSLASFFCAINDMTSELHATESKNKKMAVELTSLREKLTAALLLEEQLKGDVKRTEEYVEAQTLKANIRSQKIEFLKNKSKDLVVRIKAAEEQLAAMGLDQSLTHESLVNLSEEVAKLREEIVPLKKKLETYLDLPLSIPLAKVKVEEAKRELDALEEEFAKKIEMLTLDMLPSTKYRFT